MRRLAVLRLVLAVALVAGLLSPIGADPVSADPPEQARNDKAVQKPREVEGPRGQRPTVSVAPGRDAGESVGPADRRVDPETGRTIRDVVPAATASELPEGATPSESRDGIGVPDPVAVEKGFVPGRSRHLPEQSSVRSHRFKNADGTVTVIATLYPPEVDTVTGEVRPVAPEVSRRGEDFEVDAGGAAQVSLPAQARGRGGRGQAPNELRGNVQRDNF